MTLRQRRVIVLFFGLVGETVKTLLIVSESDQICEMLNTLLTGHFRLLRNNAQTRPDFILIAAQEDFSCFFAAKEYYQNEFPEVPMLFLWIEDTCLRIVSCSNLRYMNGITIPKSPDSLLRYLNDSLMPDAGDLQKLPEIQTDIRSHYTQKDTGAIKVEYDNFASIFQFVEQLAARSGQSVQTLLLSLLPAGGRAHNYDLLRDARALLNEAILRTLRKNDVMTGCSDSQFLVLLMDADDDGGHLAANRIYNTFLGLYEGDAYQLHYDIKPIGK